jgi:hypothetical protein
MRIRSWADGRHALHGGRRGRLERQGVSRGMDKGSLGVSRGMDGIRSDRTLYIHKPSLESLSLR